MSTEMDLVELPDATSEPTAGRGARDLEILNKLADEMNAEAEDVLRVSGSRRLARPMP